MTPRPLALAIINHFAPAGRLLDPCRGSGAFYDQFPTACTKDWCEITEGRDFLSDQQPDPWAHLARFDWSISNPPYSQWRAFNRRAMAVADNVIWLSPINHLWLKARLRDIDGAGFGIREILRVPTPAASTGWPQSGFEIGTIHLRRGYTGLTEISRLSIPT